jgi:ferredoxin
MYQIVIDRSLCSGFGACAELAPEAFEVDDGGLVSLRVRTSDGLATSCRRNRSSAPRARAGCRPSRGYCRAMRSASTRRVWSAVARRG